MAKLTPIYIFRDDINSIKQRIIREIFNTYLKEFFFKYNDPIGWDYFEKYVVDRIRTSHIPAIKDAIRKFVEAEPHYGHEGAVRQILFRLISDLKQEVLAILERMIKNGDIRKENIKELRDLLGAIYQAIAQMLNMEILDILDELMQVADSGDMPGHGEAGYDPGLGGFGWPSTDIGSHVCGCACTTQSGTCTRRTSNPGYCYQHDKVSAAIINKFKGNWKMGGFQVNVPRSGWEASLELRANRTLSWKETKGANVGAKREGRWTVRDGVVLMVYQAPNVGRVEWKSPNAAKSSMSGTYRTPEAGPQPAGWGGEWSACKV